MHDSRHWQTWVYVCVGGAQVKGTPFGPGRAARKLEPFKNRGKGSQQTAINY